MNGEMWYRDENKDRERERERVGAMRAIGDGQKETNGHDKRYLDIITNSQLRLSPHESYPQCAGR
jgi:hypothetical protein